MEDKYPTNLPHKKIYIGKFSIKTRCPEKDSTLKTETASQPDSCNPPTLLCTMIACTFGDCVLFFCLILSESSAATLTMRSFLIHSS